MPVPVKFSEKFYQTFGHDIVGELADWLSAMDLTYRSELRDLNELNVARFEARLDQRLGEVKTEMRVGFAELESRLTSRLIRWMFLFWTGTTITLLGVAFAIMRL